MRRARIGYTLVELLVVILIIGILAGGLLLSVFSSSDSAKAATLISDLRSAKAGGFMWFIDNIVSDDASIIDEWTSSNMPANLFKYVDSIKVLDYEFRRVSGVGFLLGEPNVPRAVVERAIRQSVGGGGGGILLDGNGVPLTVLSGASVTVFIKVK